jgi:hypothetical protein
MTDSDLPDDILNGADEIAGFIKQPLRTTYDLLERRKLPAFKWGGKTWQARKSTLRRHVERLEAGEATT